MYLENKLVVSQRQHEQDKSKIIVRVDGSKYEYVVSPDELTEEQSCHYCGMPAVGFGFFDEPVCKDCGG